MKDNRILFLLIPIIAGFFSLNLTPTNKEGMLPQDPPAGMVLIPGGLLHQGIYPEDLESLMSIGKDVPHMNYDHAHSWFGDEIPAHKIQIKDFYMDATEVTNAQFRHFVETTGYQPEGKWEKYAEEERSDHPVVNVTWNDAAAYASWAGKRLPAEAEWEYAARGGRRVKWYPWGDTADSSNANYRYQGESFWDGLVRLVGFRDMNTQPTGSYPANGYQLYDMVGNVSEWCADEYAAYPGGTIIEEEYSRKVVRGGSWEASNPVFIRITHRHGISPGYSDWDLGFRCAKSVP